MGSDPEAQPQRYYAEALRGLQETPVVVFADAGQRQAGRRLPYDVLEVDRTVFPPKSVLLLFEERARLLIGSGNLTFPGYSQNTELFIALDLHYDNDQDAALLRSFDQHLERSQKLARQTGSQLSLVRDELQRRLSHTADATAAQRYALLDSAAAPIIDQILRLLPEHAKITNIGMAAPFFELDDGGELDSTSVFGALKSRAAKNVTLDVAVGWENAQVQSESRKTELKDGLNQLWTWKSGDDENPVVEYLVPTAITPSKMKYLDHCGSSKHWDLQESLGAVDTRSNR